MTAQIALAEPPTATVFHLPKRSCIDCTHFDTPEDDAGLVSSHCTLWNEPLDDEKVAAECPDFEREDNPA